MSGNWLGRSKSSVSNQWGKLRIALIYSVDLQRALAKGWNEAKKIAWDLKLDSVDHPVASSKFYCNPFQEVVNRGTPQKKKKKQGGGFKPKAKTQEPGNRNFYRKS